MIVGGSDLIIEAPPEVPLTDLILARVRRFWPDSWFQDASEDDVYPIGDTRVSVRGGRSKEFFIYRDRAAIEGWKRGGATLSNMNKMLYFIVSDGDAADDEPREVTLVCGKQTRAIKQLVRDLDQSFRNSWVPVRAA
jgi:hypothetical protein